MTNRRRFPLCEITCALLALVILLCVTTPAQAVGSAPVGQPHVYKTVGERKLTLYITNPDDWKPTDSRPAVVFFHGGGWVGGKPGQFTEHSKYFASRGMVAVQVQYRLLSGKPKDPPAICIQDAKSSMRWVRGRAEKLGIDPKRIASGGGSAGGHLAAFVGMADGIDDPNDDLTVSAKSNAMLLFNPVFDNGPGGYGHARVGDRYREFSPVHNLTDDDPPAIVFLGTNDKLIPVKTATDFKAATEKAGIRCELLLFDGKPHGFFNHGRFENKPYCETVIAADKFLAALGWLEGSPTLEAP